MQYSGCGSQTEKFRAALSKGRWVQGKALAGLGGAQWVQGKALAGLGGAQWVQGKALAGLGGAQHQFACAAGPQKLGQKF